MRVNRLILLVFLGACKAVSTSSTEGSYSEDLSVHRPAVAERIENDQTIEAISEPYVALSGHIGAELDSIAKIALLENQKGKMVDGYVLQVYSGGDRNEANEERDRMGKLFPDLAPRVTYHQPNYRVKAGRFTDRLAAKQAHLMVKKEFPRALLVPERFLLKYE